MDDQQFIASINRASSESRLRLPGVGASASPSSEAVSAWAGFLERCVKSGVELSDARWRRLTVERDKPVTSFLLQAGSDLDEDDDSEFRVGLALLMGMLGTSDNSGSSDIP